MAGLLGLLLALMLYSAEVLVEVNDLIGGVVAGHFESCVFIKVKKLVVLGGVVRDCIIWGDYLWSDVDLGQ